MFNRTKQEFYSIVVSDIDRQIILQALSDLKDKQKSLHKNFSFIETIMLNICEAPQVRNKYRSKYEAR